MIILRDSQKEIVAKALDLIRKNGFVYLGMEVRTGKTHTSLSIAKELGIKNVLFITKKKAIAGIVKDYAAGEYPFNLNCTNYEQVKKLLPGYDMVIIDESHSLGAYAKPSQRTIAIRAVIGSAPVIFLSGTPTPESYSQIFHQFWVLGQRSPFARFRNFYDWARNYVNVQNVTRNGVTFKDYSDADKERLLPIINQYMITLTQGEAGFECPVIEQVHYIASDIADWLRKIYRQRVIQFKNDQGEIIDHCIADTPASLMSKMHQICGGSLICEKNKKLILSHSKAIYIKNNFADKRIVIFYKFKNELDIIKAIIPDYTDSPEEFQLGRARVFLSQIQSGREGLTLHSADCIVMYAIDYASLSYWQSRARLQTLGRESPAEVHWIFVSGGIEGKILSAVKDKKDFTLSYFARHGGI